MSGRDGRHHDRREAGGGTAHHQLRSTQEGHYEAAHQARDEPRGERCIAREGDPQAEWEGDEEYHEAGREVTGRDEPDVENDDGDERHHDDGHPEQGRQRPAEGRHPSGGDDHALERQREQGTRLRQGGPALWPRGWSGWRRRRDRRRGGGGGLLELICGGVRFRGNGISRRLLATAGRGLCAVPETLQGRAFRLSRHSLRRRRPYGRRLFGGARHRQTR